MPRLFGIFWIGFKGRDVMGGVLKWRGLGSLSCKFHHFELFVAE